MLTSLMGCAANAGESATPAGLVPATIVFLETPVATDSPSERAPDLDLSADEIDSLRSLRKVDEHPLYTMQHFGSYATYVAASTRGQPVLDGPTVSNWTGPEVAWDATTIASTPSR